MSEAEMGVQTAKSVLDMAQNRRLPDKKTIPGRTLFFKVWGSHSHGTNLPGSDIDYTGVYAADTRAVLGLRPPPDTLTGEKPDYQVHEVGKFCGLLLKGNPGIVEMLYTDRMMWESLEWKHLKKNRERFLTQQVVKQYLGYSKAQIQRLRNGQPVHSKGGVPGEKWCYHMVRVAWDAERIAKGEGPLVWKTGKELERLMSIRSGGWSTEKAVGEAEDTMARIDAIKEWKVAEEPDLAFLEGWLLGVRGV